MSDTVVRCVTLPVSKPIGSSWEELDAALVECFRLSTDAANWCVHAMFRRDVPNEPKTPQTVKRRGKNNPTGFAVYREYLSAYPGCTEPGGAWKDASQSLNICLRYAEGKYHKDRFDVMVRHKTNLLTVRYPFPFPVDADAWITGYLADKNGSVGEPNKRGEIKGGHPVVRLTLPGRRQFHLLLKAGPEFRRQLALFRQLHNGTAEKGEAALYRNRKGQLILKLVAKLPPAPPTASTNAAFINTDPAALLVVEINGRKANVTNADHIRRQIRAEQKQEITFATRMANWHPPLLLPPIPPHRGGGPLSDIAIINEIARHKTFLQRAREDKKREVRMDRRHRANLNKHTKKRCEKQRNRLNTHVNQIAAQVARMCQRQGVGLVAFDDSDKSFMRSGADDLPFPWFALRERIKQLLHVEAGLEWIDGTSEGLRADCGGAFMPLSSEDRQQWLLKAQALFKTASRVIAKKSRPPGKSHPAVSTTAAT